MTTFELPGCQDMWTVIGAPINPAEKEAAAANQKEDAEKTHSLLIISRDDASMILQTGQEIMELDNHPYYVAVQYHPEYISRPLAPSPPYFGLILASVGKLSSFLSHGCQSTTPSQELSGEEDSDEEISSMVRNLSYADTVKSVNHEVTEMGLSQASIDSQGDSQAK